MLNLHDWHVPPSTTPLSMYSFGVVRAYEKIQPEACLRGLSFEGVICMHEVLRPCPKTYLAVVALGCEWNENVEPPVAAASGHGMQAQHSPNVASHK